MSRTVTGDVLGSVLLGAELVRLVIQFGVWLRWGGARLDVCIMASIVGLVPILTGLTLGMARWRRG